MNYAEELRNLIITEGTYDEDLKITVLTLKEDVCIPSMRKKYLTVMVDEDNNIFAGAIKSGVVVIDTLLDDEVPYMYTKIKKTLIRHRPFFMKITSAVLAMAIFACLVFTIKLS